MTNPIYTEKRDYLTNCYAKEMLDPVLDKIKAEAGITKGHFSVLVLDIDHFKAYNDKYGHLDGDEVLKYFASTLRLSLPAEDEIIIRFGGDEFVVIFPGKTSAETSTIANEMRKNLKRRPFLMRGRVFMMSLSAGIASYPADGRDVSDILAKADKAMYFSKAHGRGRVTQYSSMVMKSKIEKAVIVMGAIILSAALFIMLYEPARRTVLIKSIKGIKENIPLQIVPKYATPPDKVYLRSGSVIRGTIIHEDTKEVHLKLMVKEGEAITIIKKSQIEKIEQK